MFDWVCVSETIDYDNVKICESGNWLQNPATLRNTKEYSLPVCQCSGNQRRHSYVFMVMVLMVLVHCLMVGGHGNDDDDDDN